VAWQDNRRGHYDIYVANSTDGGVTWAELGSGPINDDTGSANQLNPSLAVDGLGGVYLVWQDQRNANDDVYFSASTDGGLTWCENILVTDDPIATRQAQTSPAIAVRPQFGEPFIYITWEDARYHTMGDPSDIYFVWGVPCNGRCNTYSFDVDRRVNQDALGNYQLDPTITTSIPQYLITRTQEFTAGSPGCVTPPVVTTTVVYTAYYEGVAIHFAWQDGREENTAPDIYYAWTFAPWFQLVEVVSYPPVDCAPDPPFELVIAPFGYDYPIYGDVKVNDIAPSLPRGYYSPPPGPCDPPPKSPLPNPPSWQGYPVLAPTAPYSDGVYLAWSDGRNFDWNVDIYLARPYRPELNSPEYVVDSNIIVNDNAKLISYLQGDRYLKHGPAGVKQYRPTIVYSDEPYAVPYVAWDDNRRDDPLAGYTRIRNIFFARPGCPPSPGTYISRIFDAGQLVPWHFLEWWGATPYCSTIRFQTRTGETPWPDSSWTEWTGPVYEAKLGKWVYDAPAPIVGPGGQLYPEARYFQYRVLLDRCDRCDATDINVPWVSKVLIHYQAPVQHLWLPMVIKDQAR